MCCEIYGRSSTLAVESESRFYPVQNIIMRYFFAAIHVFLIILNTYSVQSTQNLSCYQCIRTTNVECLPEDLRPCPSNSDRCVTHIMKQNTDGFKIKRECGLGPCNFNDVMASKGLGLDTCDRSRKEYFCLFCCRESGCNKGSSSDVSSSPSNYLLILGVVLFSILTLFNRFQPPYYPESF